MNQINGHPALIITIKQEVFFPPSHDITRINPSTAFNYRHILIIKERRDDQLLSRLFIKQQKESNRRTVSKIDSVRFILI